MNTHLSVQGFPIIIGNDSLQDLTNIINESNESSFFILLDKNSRLYCLNHLIKTVPLLNNANIIELPHGEQCKSLSSLKEITLKMMDFNINRKSIIINLGGGVVSDFGGFLASILKRGIKFINIPTTLMAQVDASIGGKVGLNIGHYKNQIGVFNQPHAIIIDPIFIKTLNQEQIISGLSEIFKYALINDVSLWHKLSGQTFNNFFDFKIIIEDCVKTKISIINDDIFDWTHRRKLNFGHSIGHAIESLAFERQKPISHGLAVAIGMICESYISYLIFNFDKSMLEDITSTLFKYFPYYEIMKKDYPAILDYFLKDKKNSASCFNFTLLSKIGSSEINCNVTKELIFKSLDYYRSYA